jgi:hypothetical protein
MARVEAERDQWRSAHGQELAMRMKAERLLTEERDEVELKRAALAGVQADRDATERDNARLRADLKTWQDKLHEVREDYAALREDYAAALARAEEVIAHHVERLAAKEHGEPVDDPFELPGKHCDDYIHDFTAPHCLRFFLLVNRMPAVDAMLCRAAGVLPKLFATYEGARVRVVMASRLGDVGVTRRLDAEDGYEKRVMVADLTSFGDIP